MIDTVTQAIRENYDRLAEEYANHLFDELAKKPFDREILDRFATEIKSREKICDMGCGPGHIARYLRDAGTNIFGLDLSVRMIQEARRLNPDISFRVGDMMALNIPDGSLAGIVAFYAIVNTPKESLALVFREMQRALQPGGLLLISFHVGDETLHPSELWGKAVSMDFFLFQPSVIQECLEAAGFSVNEVLEREPYPPDVEYQSRRAYIFARKSNLPA